MGSPIEYPGVGVICPECWGPAGPFRFFDNPEFIQATVTGIAKGPLWNPALPDPPNGFFEISQDAPCIWSSITVTSAVDLVYAFGATVFSIALPGMLNVFLGVGGPCKLGVPNTHPAFGLLYTGGSASWTWIGGP